MKRSFLNPSPHTMIAAIMTGKTPADLIAQIRNAETAGADGIGIELLELQKEFRTRENFEQILAVTALPVMFFSYRNDLCNGADDEARLRDLLLASQAGAAMIDVMGDLFSPAPDENTHDAHAIKRQKELIAQLHANGSQVVMSSHPQRFMKSEEVISQLRDFEQRGADVVKIVTTANTEEEFLETIRATMTATRELRTPFIHLCNGKFGRIHRFLGLKLGLAITFAVERYQAGSPFTQPTIRDFKSVAEHLPWHIAD